MTFHFTLVTPVPHMHSLFANGLFWTSVACCAVAQVYIIRSVRGARYVPEPTAVLPHARNAVEMLWAVLPAIGLVVLLLFTWRAIQSTSAARSHAAPAASATSTT